MSDWLDEDSLREENADLKAEVERLRAALTVLSDAFHPGCRAEFELQPVQFYADTIAAALREAETDG